MNIKILPKALEDLDRGRQFYARQRRSLGDYFLDALFTDIDSLEHYAGIHMKVLASQPRQRVGFPADTTITSFGTLRSRAFMH